MTQQIEITPRRAAALLIAARMRLAGGPGSGNFGHAGRPGEIGGSSSEAGAAAEKRKWEAPHPIEDDAPRQWAWDVNKDRVITAKPQHQRVRFDKGAWGYSHGGSQAIAGEAATQMGIAGYRQTYGDPQIAERFLQHIADDGIGSEEPLYHSFQNVRHTDFKVGDTMRLPLTATSGDVGSYGIRSDAKDQSGEPTVFVFEKNTQMVGYSTITPRDAKDVGFDTVEEALKDRQYLWDEAIIAGGFEVTRVEKNVGLGLQHDSRGKGYHGVAVGSVVYLRQTETFDPKTGWKRRG